MAPGAPRYDGGDTVPGPGAGWLRIAVRDTATTDAVVEVLARILEGVMVEQTIEAIRPLDQAATAAARKRPARLTDGSSGVPKEPSVGRVTFDSAGASEK